MEKHSEDILLDELAKVFHEREMAVLIATKAGYPRSRVPKFTAPIAFWAKILDEIQKGAIHNGTSSLIDIATSLYPDNDVFQQIQESQPEHNNPTAPQKNTSHPRHFSPVTTIGLSTATYATALSLTTLALINEPAAGTERHNAQDAANQAPLRDGHLKVNKPPINRIRITPKFSSGSETYPADSIPSKESAHGHLPSSKNDSKDKQPRKHRPFSSQSDSSRNEQRFTHQSQSTKKSIAQNRIPTVRIIGKSKIEITTYSSEHSLGSRVSSIGSARRAQRKLLQRTILSKFPSAATISGSIDTLYSNGEEAGFENEDGSWTIVGTYQVQKQ